jgi:hypothetical protein
MLLPFLDLLPELFVSVGCIGKYQYPSAMRRPLRTKAGLSKHSSMVSDCPSDGEVQLPEFDIRIE